MEVRLSSESDNRRAQLLDSDRVMLLAEVFTQMRQKHFFRLNIHKKIIAMVC